MVCSARRDSRSGDHGRTVVEAVVAMAIVLVAAASWMTLNESAGSAQEATGIRREALALARAELDAIVALDPAAAGLDPTEPGWAATFEGSSMVSVPGGLTGSETVDQNGQSYAVTRRVVLEQSSGGATWKRFAVFVVWSDRFGNHEIRLDGGGLDGS